MRIMQIITDYIAKSILTTHGDLVVRGASIPERLVAVAVGQVLKSAGVGAKPAWGKPSIADLGMANGYYTRSTTGNEVITGIGFLPALLILFAGDQTTANKNWSAGFDDNANMIILIMDNNGAESRVLTAQSIYIKRDGSNFMTGQVSALGAGGFTVTHALTGTCPINVSWFAIG